MKSVNWFHKSQDKKFSIFYGFYFSSLIFSGLSKWSIPPLFFGLNKNIYS